MNNIAYIALGTNMGERAVNMYQAMKLLQDEEGIDLVNASSIYETDPVGYTDQDPFLNMVLKVDTTLPPHKLLEKCLQIEQKLGRKRKIKWGPRIIDLDILLYNQENIESEHLIVPHPLLHERAFVLVPLLEVDSNLQMPSNGRLIQSYLDELSDREGVRIWKQKNGEDVFALFEN